MRDGLSGGTDDRHARQSRHWILAFSWRSIPLHVQRFDCCTAIRVFEAVVRERQFDPERRSERLLLRAKVYLWCPRSRTSLRKGLSDDKLPIHS